MFTYLSRQILNRLISKPNIRIQTVGLVNLSASQKERKRFYQNVSVSRSAETSQFEINLDKRKLKTPYGQIFQVNDEILANMIAFEWQSQQDTIKLGTMHLTSLVNTCIDNPNKLTKERVIEQIIEYLQTDTLLYFDSNSVEKLEKLQETKWRPLVDWFNLKFKDINLKISYGLDVTSITDIQNSSFNKYLDKNFNLSSLIAFNYIAECLKSIILTVALLERYISTVEEACKLSGLEQEHQYDQWGKVEWYHDVNEQELKARVSAALLLIYLSRDSKYYLIKNKV